MKRRAHEESVEWVARRWSHAAHNARPFEQRDLTKCRHRFAVVVGDRFRVFSAFEQENVHDPSRIIGQDGPRVTASRSSPPQQTAGPSELSIPGVPGARASAPELAGIQPAEADVLALSHLRVGPPARGQRPTASIGQVVSTDAIAPPRCPGTARQNVRPRTPCQCAQLGNRNPDAIVTGQPTITKAPTRPSPQPMKY